MTTGEWSELLVSRLNEEIGRRIPGVASDIRVWPHVDQASAEMLLALVRWERTEALEDKRAAVRAAEIVLDAWTAAGQLYGAKEPHTEAI